MVYADQLLSVMSNRHTELYKHMILVQYLYFLQQNQYFSVLTLLPHCMFDHISSILYVCNFVNLPCIACVISRFKMIIIAYLVSFIVISCYWFRFLYTKVKCKYV